MRYGGWTPAIHHFLVCRCVRSSEKEDVIATKESFGVSAQKSLICNQEGEKGMLGVEKNTAKQKTGSPTKEHIHLKLSLTTT